MKCDAIQAVNLPAVVRERVAMADTATRYPNLLTPAAAERCAAWLDGDAVKRLDPEAEGETTQLAVRLPADLIAILEAEVARLNSLAPGVRFSKSDALRAIIAAYRPGTAAPMPAKSSQQGTSKGASLLARYRKAHAAGHSNVEVAGAIGTSESTLRRWLNGNGEPRDEMKTKLAEWLSAKGF